MATSSTFVQFDEEINHLTFHCTYIAQISSNIRNNHLSNISCSTKNISLYNNLLLSIAENIEGSTILLELLLSNQNKNFKLIDKNKSKRYHYTRDELLQLQKQVNLKLSNEIETVLKQIVERESNDSVNRERRSCRDIRIILM